MASTTVYLKLRPRWGDHDWNSDKLRGFDVEGVTKNRPSRSSGPVVKLTLKVPDQAFMPLRPEVVIDVPEQALDYTPIVSVELPDDPEPVPSGEGGDHGSP